MINDFGPSAYDNLDESEAVRPGPLWRHTVWVVGFALAGVGLGWATGLFRITPEQYGLPEAAPGPLLPYLAAWTLIGLAAAGVLRAAAAKVPVYAPGVISLAVTGLGTRLSLGWRPEWPVLAGMAAAALAVAAGWSLMALRPVLGAKNARP